MNMTSIDAQLRLAIVGCGAVTELLHLPALSTSCVVNVTALVDPNVARLKLLAGSRADLHLATSTEGIERYADAAIIAAPHHLHRSIAVDLLERGLHVLVEKPLAVSLQDADAIVETARSNGRYVGVGLIRRQYSSFRFVRKILEEGWLGPIRSFDWREGSVLSWPVTTAAPFRLDQHGGVLFDTGAHSLDTLLAWLGPFEAVEYFDDARGGVEANCLLQLKLSNGVIGTVELSRTRDLRNTCVITGESGELETGFLPHSSVVLRAGSLALNGVVTAQTASAPTIHAADRAQIEAFAESISIGKEPDVSATGTREPIRLFDACRKDTRRMELSWEPFDVDINWSQFNGRRVLVLGGTGFLGGRLVEALAQRTNADVRVLVRDFSKLPNIARYPIETIQGDVGDPEALRRSMSGCDYVFNCTYGKGEASEQARVNIDAVGAIVSAASQCGVTRLVHTSTVSVYGVVEDATVTEGLQSRAPKADVYGYTKWRGEELLLAESRKLGLSAVAVQPTVVYGPGAPSWTLSPIRSLRSGKVVLVEGGKGISNSVYVDDVVAALLQAAVAPDASGERLLVSGPDVVSWAKFFGAYCDILGQHNTVAMNSSEIAAARRDRKRQSGNLARLRAILREEYQGNAKLIELPALVRLRNLVRAYVPRRYIEDMKRQVITGELSRAADETASLALHLPSREQESFYSATAVVSIERAKRIIGYSPKYSLDDGMSLVARWARWANLCPSQES